MKMRKLAESAAILLLAIIVLTGCSGSPYTAATCLGMAEQFGAKLNSAIKELEYDPLHPRVNNRVFETLAEHLNELGRAVFDQRLLTCESDPMVERAESHLTPNVRSVLYTHTQSQQDPTRAMADYDEWRAEFKALLSTILPRPKPTEEPTPP